MAGNASLSANRTWRHLKGEVERMLKEAEAADAAAGAGEEGVPEELVDRKGRLKRAKEELERLAAEVTQDQNDVHQFP